ncbi:MAG: VapC toxin family PIN domain ribonuclease [Acidobacteria bacterium]|nr:MAG: VapC toxin family PIN domain ribonuclease [Acidobacteriota bacterium]
MILVDANILVYAHVSSTSQHLPARKWLDNRLNGTASVGLPWESLLAFIRLTTNPRIFQKPETISDAWKQVESWLDCQNVWIPQPTERHREILGSLLKTAGTGGNLTPDAHLAALALEHGLILCSTDGDFARFPDLRWENPLS